jgi:alpha/beta superfamily hydrolase
MTRNFEDEDHMQFQKLSFVNSQGQKLAARLDLPVDEKPVAYALFAHCFTCGKNLTAIVNINRALARVGIAVLRFDFTGLGESEGDFAETSFSSNVDDLIAAARFLESSFEAPKILIGHSLGGAAVLQAAARIESVRAVATIAAPCDLSQLARFLSSSVEEIEDKGEGRFTMAGKSFKIRKKFLDDLERTRMEETIGSLRKALLIFHSPVDATVDIENAAKIFRTARHPKSFISLDQADHLLSKREDSLYVGSVLSAWAGKYIGIPQERRQEKDLRDNRVVVRTGKIGYRTEISANGHSLLADEPIAVGGSDTGPTPYDYLVAALGA